MGLGVAYHEGKGVERNLSEAARLLEQSGLEGSAKGAYYAFLAYDLGEGVQKDPEKAHIWLVRAAEGGFNRAQVLLGQFCWIQAKPADLIEAAKWFRLAFGGGLPLVTNDLKTVESQLSPAEREEVKKRARAWFRSH